jgi:hypothetical protein
MLQSMERFESLNSEELILWWKTTLCQLNDETEHEDSGLCQLPLRVHDVFKHTRCPNKVVDDIDEKRWLLCWES